MLISITPLIFSLYMPKFTPFYSKESPLGHYSLAETLILDPLIILDYTDLDNYPSSNLVLLVQFSFALSLNKHEEIPTMVSFLLHETLGQSSC